MSRLCKNSHVELARRKFVSIALNKKRSDLPIIVGRRKERTQFCAFSARARFHTAWVKNGSDPASSASPFYPQEQTSSDHPGMSEKCQKRKWKPRFDKRPNSNAVHGDESCFEPCLGFACWLSRALPRRYGEIGRSAFRGFLQHELGHGIAGKVVKDGGIGRL